MKKNFFQLLRIFTASTCQISEISKKPTFYPEGEVWASFTFDGFFGLTGNCSNSKYNGTPTIVYGNLKEKEIFQLISLFKQAAKKEERQNYKTALESAASNLQYYWHINFERRTDAWKISQLELRLKEAHERIAELLKQIDHLESSRFHCEYDEE